MIVTIFTGVYISISVLLSDFLVSFLGMCSQFKEISKYYLIETRWFNAGYVPTYEEYMNVALITCGYKLLTLISFVGMGDIATKEAFEWARSMPKLVKAVSMVNRLRDDITSNKVYIKLLLQSGKKLLLKAILSAAKSLFFFTVIRSLGRVVFDSLSILIIKH